MTEREEGELRGDVKSCRLERDYVYPDHHWVMFTTDTYTREGRLLEKKHVNPDGSKWWVINHYDERGLLTRKERGGEEPVRYHQYSYEYDAVGRLERIVYRSTETDGSAKERIHEAIQYHADGSKTKTEYPPRLGNAGASIESMLHFSADAVAIVTIFDAADRAIHKVLYDADHRVIHEVGFKYDERGLLIEEGELVGGEILEDFRNVFTHDDSGRVIEVDQRSSLGSVRRRFVHNEHGDNVQEMTEQNIVFCELDDDGPERWTEHHAYQYDEHGNWIERTTEVLTADETRVSRIERRQIEYYGPADGITDSDAGPSGENS